MTGRAAIVVAALDGAAVGGGAQLAIAADLRVAAPAAFLQLAGPGHGLAVGAWGLPSLVGRGRALDLCLSMRPVEREEALAIGLVDRVADDAAAGGPGARGRHGRARPGGRRAREARGVERDERARGARGRARRQPRGLDGSMQRAGAAMADSAPGWSGSMQRAGPAWLTPTARPGGATSARTSSRPRCASA